MLLFENVAVCFDVLQKLRIDNLSLVVTLNISSNLLVTSCIHFRIRLAVAGNLGFLMAIHIHHDVLVIVSIIVFIRR